MKIEELANILNEYYTIGKKRRECNSLVQCFGIKYGNLIIENNFMPEDIVNNSILNGTTYATEIRKGIKLSNYVIIKDGIKLP